MTHDLTDLERVNLIVKALVHCEQQVTRDAVREQFRRETGRSPEVKGFRDEDEDGSARAGALQSSGTRARSEQAESAPPVHDPQLGSVPGGVAGEGGTVASALPEM